MAGCAGAQVWHSPLHRIPQGIIQRRCIPLQNPCHVPSCQGLHWRNSHSAKHGQPWGRKYGYEYGHRYGLLCKSTSTRQVLLQRAPQGVISIIAFCCASDYLLLGASVVYDIWYKKVFRHPVLHIFTCLRVER